MYSLRDAPFDTTSNVRTASIATADAIVATTTTGKKDRVCACKYAKTHVSAQQQQTNARHHQKNKQ
jgi:hypothetical protein